MGGVWSSIIIFGILLFSIIFVYVPQVPQYVFQDVPNNSITLASHIICPRKSNVIIKVHKMRGAK
jgi:hypothetical protein